MDALHRSQGNPLKPRNVPRKEGSEGLRVDAVGLRLTPEAIVSPNIRRRQVPETLFDVPRSALQHGRMRPRLRRDLWSTSAVIVLSLLSSPVFAETVKVKDRGDVDLARFECNDKTRSGFITRVCYDAGNHYLLLGFEDGSYYQFCGVGAGAVRGLLSAPSIAKFYNTRIRGTEGDGPHDCRGRRKQ